MEQLLETIQAATAADASPEARAAGAQACRELLAALEPQPTPAPSPGPPPAELKLPIAELAAAIRTVPLDQLLEISIAKLRTARPAGVEVPAVTPLKIQLVPIGGHK